MRSSQRYTMRMTMPMRSAWIVFRKEVVDNFHDRRTVLWALLFGPLLGPALFALMATLIVERAVDSAQEPLELAVVGAASAPHLMDFLERYDVTILAPPADPEQAVREGTHDLVLVVGEDYAQQLTSGRPAQLQLILDQSDAHAGTDVARLRRLLHGYSEILGTLRLQARGVARQVTQPLLVETIDVSTPTGRSVLILGMMTYFILFSMLIGGMYLAIDATAGERERGSLEPLLTLPVAREHLILGKIAATCFYMLLSLVATVTLFAVLLRFVPLEALGMSANFSPRAAAASIAIMLPFILVGAGLMTVVASFTHSYKEAQTWMSLVLFVPTLPILLAALQALRPSLHLMVVPSLSQHLLITELIKNEPVDPSWVLVSAATTTLVGLLFIWLATVLYRRESLLSS